MIAAANAFLILLLVLSIFGYINPASGINANIRFYRFVFKMSGFDVEFKPVKPGRPEKIARFWSAVWAIVFATALAVLKSKFSR